MSCRTWTAIVDAKSRAEALRRAVGATAREWLDAIDALVAMGKDAGAYRTATLDEEQLWSTFADEGADTPMRARRPHASSHDPRTTKCARASRPSPRTSAGTLRPQLNWALALAAQAAPMGRV